MTKSHGGTVLEFTREEIITQLEREAQRRLKMSAKAMLRAYREGRLADSGSVADLLALSNLLRKDDPIFGAD